MSHARRSTGLRSFAHSASPPAFSHSSSPEHSFENEAHRPGRESDIRELRPRPEVIVPASTASTLPADAAARRIVEALVARGVDTFFGVPGGPVCAIFEAIRLTEGARLVASRHETHAAFAASTFHAAT